MKAKEFLIKKIKELNSEFPNFLFKYGYDELSHSHHIVVVSNNTNDSDTDFQEIQIKLYLEFIDMFPYDSLTIDVEENDLIFTEELLFPGNSYSLINLDVSEYEVLLFANYWYKFPEELEINVHIKKQGQYIFDYDLSKPNVTASICKNNLGGALELLLMEKSKFGENNYALAA